MSPTLTLIYNTANPAANAWTSAAVTLLAAGFHVGAQTGAAATEAQLRAVLSNLTALEIRAEFTTSVDTFGIDNVVLQGFDAPEPQPAWMLSSGFLLIAAGALKSRRVR